MTNGPQGTDWGCRVIGSGFLIVYGCFAARRAIRPGALVPTNAPSDIATKTAVLRAVNKVCGECASAMLTKL